MARDRKSSQRRRANAQPARARPKPAAGDSPAKPAAGDSPPGRPADAAKPPTAPRPDDRLDAVQADASADHAVEVDASADRAVKVDASADDVVEADGTADHAVEVDATADHDAARDDAVSADASVDGRVNPGATVDDLDDESVNATLEGADLPVGVMPTDPPILPPVGLTDGDAAAAAGERASARERLAANRLDESDEILPAARRAGRPPAKVGGNKVTSFLRASWAELQRVQWPDRRQVGQATAVVLGFVVVAGGFLGLADLVGTDVVNAIL